MSEKTAARIAEAGNIMRDVLRNRLVVVMKNGAIRNHLVESPWVIGRELSSDELLSMLLVEPDCADFTAAEIRNSVIPKWQALALQDIATGVFYENGVSDLEMLSTPLNGRWTRQRMPFDPNPNAQIPPAYMEYISRIGMKMGESYMMWWGLHFFPHFPRDQYLFCHGSGGDGKSSVAAAIRSVFRQDYVVELNSTMLKGNHSTAALEDAGLLFFNEDNSSSFMSTSLFKTITGDESITVDPKYKEHRRIKLKCRVCINSNNKPTVTGQEADYRRLIYVPITARTTKGIEADYRERLKRETPEFLQACYELARKWVEAHPNAGLIEVPGEMRASVEDDSHFAGIADMLTTKLEFAAGNDAKCSSVSKAVSDLFGRNTMDYRTAMQLIQSKAKKVRLTDDSRVWRGVRMLHIEVTVN